MVALPPLKPDDAASPPFGANYFPFTGEGSGELLGQNLSFPGSTGHYPCVNHAYYKAFPSLSTPSHGGDTGSIPGGTTNRSHKLSCQLSRGSWLVIKVGRNPWRSSISSSRSCFCSPVSSAIPQSSMTKKCGASLDAIGNRSEVPAVRLLAWLAAPLFLPSLSLLSC